MAAHRTLTPAMRAHLRQIAALGGKATALKYGGFAAPHAARRARQASQPQGVPATRAQPRTSGLTANHRTFPAPKSPLPPSLLGKVTTTQKRTGTSTTTKRTTGSR